jgi:hypothetical protein
MKLDSVVLHCRHLDGHFANLVEKHCLMNSDLFGATELTRIYEVGHMNSNT